MPALSYDGTTLVLTTSDRPELATGRHRLFISSVVGLRYDEQTRTFRATAPREAPKLIEQLVDYLTRVGVDCQLDGRSQLELNSLQKDRDVLVRAREDGLGIKQKEFQSIEVPGLVRQLMPYQINSVMHAITVPHSANFSVPGSGKTTIALSTYAVLKKQGVVSKILVIGPRSCFVPWEEEYEGCFGARPRVLRVVGEPDHRRFLLRTARDVELYLVTYQMAVNESRELANLLQTADFLLILDESHYIKRLEGGIWAENVLELGRYAKKRLILTGTPAPNSLVDLWSQFTFLWPSKSLLGERAAFKAQAEQAESAETLKDRLEPFFCRI